MGSRNWTIAKITATLRNGFQSLFATSVAAEEEEYNRAMSRTVGSGYALCEAMWWNKETNKAEKKTLLNENFGEWPKENEYATVGLRSISKTIVAVTFLRLVDMNMMSLNDSVGDYLPYDCGNASHSKMGNLLSMSATYMDDRLNAARVKQRNDQNLPTDFLGWPPLCDELGYENAIECASKFICPFYRQEKPAYEAVGIMDNFDVPERYVCAPPENATLTTSCASYAKEGACTFAPRYMYDACPTFCSLFKNNVCDSDREACVKIAREGLCKEGDNAKKCKYSCKLGNETHPVRFEYHYDETKNEVYKSKWYGNMIYDNYGYTLLDAAVTHKTGKSMLDWSLELVLKPLKMYGVIKCTFEESHQGVNECKANDAENEFEKYTCYYPPKTIFESKFGKKWEPFPKGRANSKTWISNAYFGSARDVSNLILMLANKGVSAEGERILSENALAEMFTKKWNTPPPYGNLLAFQSFSLGIGHCETIEDGEYGEFSPYKDLRLSEVLLAKTPNELKEKRKRLFSKVGTRAMCLAPDWWGWASSHGSRYSILLDQNVSCIVSLNMALGKTTSGEMFNTRAHYVGHNASAIMRYVFPKL